MNTVSKEIFFCRYGDRLLVPFAVWYLFSVLTFFLICSGFPLCLTALIFLSFLCSVSLSLLLSFPRIFPLSPSIWILYLCVSSFPLSACLTLFPLSVFHLNSLICLLFCLYYSLFGSFPSNLFAFPFVCFVGVFLFPLSFLFSTFRMPLIFLFINSWNEVSVGWIILQYLTFDDTRRLGPFHNTARQCDQNNMENKFPTKSMDGWIPPPHLPQLS